jgi:hypothetical protein
LHDGRASQPPFGAVGFYQLLAAHVNLCYLGVLPENSRYGRAAACVRDRATMMPGLLVFSAQLADKLLVDTIIENYATEIRG